jgi:hypothetical protein
MTVPSGPIEGGQSYVWGVTLRSFGSFLGKTVRRHPVDPMLRTLLILLAVPQIASAYVDPGSGAMLWQILAATFLGTLFYIRKIMAAISRVLRNSTKPVTESNGTLPIQRSTSAGD